MLDLLEALPLLFLFRGESGRAIFSSSASMRAWALRDSFHASTSAGVGTEASLPSTSFSHG